MVLTSNHLIQINATIISGILVLLGISAQQGSDIAKIAETNPAILEYSLMVQIVLRAMIIPFAVSATAEIIHSFRHKDRDNHASKLGMVTSIIGFIGVLAFFMIEILGGLTLLSG